MNTQDLHTLADRLKEAADGLQRGARMQGFNSPTGVSMMAGHYAVGAIATALKSLAMEKDKR